MPETRCHCRKSVRAGTLGAFHLQKAKMFSVPTAVGWDGMEHAQVCWGNLAILAMVPCAHSPPCLV